MYAIVRKFFYCNLSNMLNNLCVFTDKKRQYSRFLPSLFKPNMQYCLLKRFSQLIIKSLQPYVRIYSDLLQNKGKQVKKFGLFPVVKCLLGIPIQIRQAVTFQNKRQSHKESSCFLSFDSRQRRMQNDYQLCQIHKRSLPYKQLLNSTQKVPLTFCGWIALILNNINVKIS